MGLNYSTMGEEKKNKNKGRANAPLVSAAKNHYGVYLSPLWEQNLDSFLCCGNHLEDCDE